jgi:hypothetical protein
LTLGAAAAQDAHARAALDEMPFVSNYAASGLTTFGPQRGKSRSADHQHKDAARTVEDHPFKPPPLDRGPEPMVVKEPGTATPLG